MKETPKDVKIEENDITFPCYPISIGRTEQPNRLAHSLLLVRIHGRHVCMYVCMFLGKPESAPFEHGEREKYMARCGNEQSTGREYCGA